LCVTFCLQLFKNSQLTSRTHIPAQHQYRHLPVSHVFMRLSPFVLIMATMYHQRGLV